MVKEKKERPNFYGMFSQNLPISATFIAILKITLPQCNTTECAHPMVLNVVRYLAEPIRIYHARKLTCLSGCVFHIFGLQNLQRHCQEKNSCSVIASGFLHRPSSYYACLKIVSYWIFLFIIAKV